MAKHKKKTLFADVLETVTKYFLVLVVIVVLFILLSGIRVVESGNVALVLRFGKIVGDNYEEQIHEPGLLFAFPYFIDEVVIIPSDQVMEQTVLTHYTAGTEITGSKGGYLVTGDRNVALVSASVKYTVTDPVAYALHVEDVPSLVNATVSAGMVVESAGMNVDALLTTDKLAFASHVSQYAVDKLSMMGAGVTITSLELTQVIMPEEVRADYENVNAAKLQKNTIVERAGQYATTADSQARAEKFTLVSNARAAQSNAVAAANTELAEFWGVLEEYKKDPDGVKARLYSDRVRQVFQKIGKVYVVQDEDSSIFIPQS